VGDVSASAAVANALLAVIAGTAGAVAFSAFLGLGMHRRGLPLVVVVVAMTLVAMPPLAVALVGPADRWRRFLAIQAVWALFLITLMPVYFPGERRDAVATGLAVLHLGPGWETVARRVADHLPLEPRFSEPEPEEAVAVPVVAVAPRAPLAADEIALPYDGQGRRLSVPVAFQHHGRTLELWMMLDTGATYTTLPGDLLAQLGLTPGADAPVLTLHTANGDRDAPFVVADTVWLGDLGLEGVAIAQCDACPSGDTSGLLGLNVTGGYNLTIDADRQEVVFSSREGHNHKLDVGPFITLSAQFSRFPGGRVEVEVTLRNDGPRTIDDAMAIITCTDRPDDAGWGVPLQDVGPGDVGVVRHRLPEHGECQGYRVGLGSAHW